MGTKAEPFAVLISDIHYNLTTLPLADAALRQAIQKSNELAVPLIIAGDLHDTKALMRAECINALLPTIKTAKMAVYIIRGNHDSINERSEESALNFLASYATIVNKPAFFNDLGSINRQSVYLIPYHHDPAKLQEYLKKIDPGTCIIMHQGVQGSLAGDYIIDKSALPKEAFADFRVISGHYHPRQDIKCGRPRVGSVGLFSYIGNPYTLGFGEANDPEKGFQILMSNGSLEWVPTNLPRHRVFHYRAIDLLENVPQHFGMVENDPVWIKVSGTKEQLKDISKELIYERLECTFPFRLDLIPLDTNTTAPEAASKMTQAEVLDALIDSTANTSEERKTRLKEMWKNL